MIGFQVVKVSGMHEQVVLFQESFGSFVFGGVQSQGQEEPPLRLDEMQSRTIPKNPDCQGSPPADFMLVLREGTVDLPGKAERSMPAQSHSPTDTYRR